MSQFSSKIYCFNPSFDTDSTIRDKTIFHYTSPEAMISILRNESIRFTDCQFLNDRTEYNHILDPLKEAIAQVESTLYNKEITRLVEQQLGKNYQYEKFTYKRDSEGKILLETTFSRYYVFCASIAPDSLSMWNYYVKSGSYQGYNIGISVNRIIDSLPTQLVDSLMYGQVIHDNKQKISLLTEVLESADDALEAAKRELKDDEDYEFELESVQDEVMFDLVRKLNYYRLFFKDGAFEDEKEFRIAILLPQAEDTSTASDIVRDFTTKHGVITPHFDLKVPKKCFRRINLSPMLESELAVEGLRRLLYSYKYNPKIDIRTSAIPIRY